MALFSHTKKKHRRQNTEKRRAIPYTPFHEEENTVMAPLAGKVKPLEECADPTFSSGQVGQGVVLIPETLLLKSPVTGKVLMIFPTLSSISVEDSQGREILMHLGLGSSQMDGKPFYSYVSEGDHVQAGQPLIAIDWKAIEEAGGSREVPIVLPKCTEQDCVSLLADHCVQEGNPLFRIQSE